MPAPNDAARRAWNSARKSVAGAQPDLSGNADGRRLREAGWQLVCLLTCGLGLWRPPGGGTAVPQWVATARLDAGPAPGTKEPAP